MACETKLRNGSCNHFQCPHSHETSHGYECVDIIGSAPPFCEVGCGCLPKCRYSWVHGSGSAVELSTKTWMQQSDQELADYFNQIRGSL